MKFDDGFTLPAPELAECARINFNNLANMVVGLKDHPFFKLAMSQLEGAIVRLNNEEEEA